MMDEQNPAPHALPRVAEARARDLLARAKLRSLLPEKMHHLEQGPAGKRAADELRIAVFGSPNDGGAE